MKSDKFGICVRSASQNPSSSLEGQLPAPNARISKRFTRLELDFEASLEIDDFKLGSRSTKQKVMRSGKIRAERSRFDPLNIFCRTRSECNPGPGEDEPVVRA